MSIGLGNITFNKFIKVLSTYVFVLSFITIIKLRMEIGNMSKRQQPDQRADNMQRPPMGLQPSENIPHPEVVLS